MPSSKVRRPGPSKPLPQTVLLVQPRLKEASELQTMLEREGFGVVVKGGIKEALTCLNTQGFTALICDLHLPSAGDGFTLVNAMRHLHPRAINIVMSDYPALRESVGELLPQADEILVTPLPLSDVVTLLRSRLKDPRHRTASPRASVATILERYTPRTIADWLRRVKENPRILAIPLSDENRTGHLRTLLMELIQRLRTPRFDEGVAEVSHAAIAHGLARRHQGYSAALLVEESRILQVSIFSTLRSNLNAVDLALVLTDVMTIADEVDSQLTQTMASFSEIPQSKNGRAKVR